MKDMITAGADPVRTDAARRTVLVLMCVGYFLVLLDVTIVNTALPRIGIELSASLAGLQWVVDGYTVALAALMLAAGTVGDRHGHKRLVLVGLGVLTVASLGCGLATSVTGLVLFRVVQGVGAAVMLPGTLAVISHAYPGRREQARAIGVWAGVGSAALVVGPAVGGVLTDLVTWRAVFLVNVPVGLLVLPLAWRTVRESVDAHSARLDVPGVVVGAAALAAVTLGIIELGHDGPSATTMVALGAAVVLVLVLVIVERRAVHPMLPPELFRTARFSAANLVAGGMNLGTVGVLFVFNLYLQQVLGYSALAAGLALLPLYVPLCVLAPLGGRLVARVGPRRPMIAGLVLAAGGLGLLVPLDEHSGFAAILPALVAWGVGLGLLTPAVVSAAIDAVPAPRAGLASAVNNTSRQAFQAVGIAAFGAIAGSPAAAGFLPGFRTTALLAAGVDLAGALLVIVAFRESGRSLRRGRYRRSR